MISGSRILRWPSLLLAVVCVFPLRAAAAESVVPVTFKQLRAGQAVISLPAHWMAHGPEVPVWLHLHGAPAVVEANFAAVGAPGVLVNVTLPGLSKAYADHFAAADRLAELLREVETALQRESAVPTRLGRLTVSSFSAGFGGVRQLLKHPASFERIAALVMADSIYCGYASPPAEKRVDPELMEGFLRFARLATEGQKRMLISHSRQVPEGYASTTETADYLIQQLAGARSFETQEWRGDLRMLSSFTRGQLDILGFDGESPDAHLRHLRSIGVFLERALPPGLSRRATSVDELRAQIDGHVMQPRFRGAVWGVKVASLDSGKVVYHHHADRLLSPASNSKLYTGALALDRLGGDYRIITPVLATAAPNTAGDLGSDVWVSGRGDPSWKSGARRTAFWNIFEPFVAVLANAGVRQITGDIVADATYFRGPPNGAGWTADDLNDYYGAELSAITIEDNYVELRITPAAVAGQPCELALVQPHTGLVLENRTTTVEKGGARTLAVRRIFGESTVHVFGQLPVGNAPVFEDVTMPRPANWFAAALKEALVRRGITVDGNARSIRWPATSPVGENCTTVGEITSPPLRDLVSAFMKPSQNLETNLILAHLGETTRTAETPAWRTSEQLGVAALREFLRENGLSADEVRFEEGSGLSRNNLTTANATLELLKFMAAHREAKAFIDSLPIAGVDGTLRRRMKGTPAEGNVRAKTGTLRWANALSGYVTSASGERLVFSVMLNRNVVPPGRNARDDVDAIAVMLAGFSGRSDTPANHANGRE